MLTHCLFLTLSSSGIIFSTSVPSPPPPPPAIIKAEEGTGLFSSRQVQQVS